MNKLLGKLGWRGQCSCCNDKKPNKAIRKEEMTQFEKEYWGYIPQEHPRRNYK